MKDRIIELLRETKREGIEDLITYLLQEGFFTAPASTKFHGAYEGGLAKHSLGVYDMFTKLCPDKITEATGYGQKPLAYANLAIVCLLHDICKIGAYVRTKADDGWTSNRNKDKGHGLLSVERAKKFIKLEPLEEMMIKFHMAVYDTHEFDGKGEYPIRSDKSECEGMSKEESSKFRYGKSLANVYYHNPICKVLSACDELVTLNEKAEE